MNKPQLNKVWSFLRNKFFLKLKKDTTYYIDKIKQDRQSINLLETDKENLEKFARERYLMKAPDEDVYIIVKD